MVAVVRLGPDVSLPSQKAQTEEGGVVVVVVQRGLVLRLLAGEEEPSMTFSLALIDELQKYEPRLYCLAVPCEWARTALVCFLGHADQQSVDRRLHAQTSCLL